jgi:hypothetical protein
MNSAKTVQDAYKIAMDHIKSDIVPRNPHYR